MSENERQDRICGALKAVLLARGDDVQMKPTKLYIAPSAGTPVASTCTTPHCPQGIPSPTWAR